MDLEQSLEAQQDLHQDQAPEHLVDVDLLDQLKLTNDPIDDQHLNKNKRMFLAKAKQTYDDMQTSDEEDNQSDHEEEDAGNSSGCSDGEKDDQDPPTLLSLMNVNLPASKGKETSVPPSPLGNEPSAEYNYAATIFNEKLDENTVHDVLNDPVNFYAIEMSAPHLRAYMHLLSQVKEVTDSLHKSVALIRGDISYLSNELAAVKTEVSNLREEVKSTHTPSDLTNNLLTRLINTVDRVEQNQHQVAGVSRLEKVVTTKLGETVKAKGTRSILKEPLSRMVSVPSKPVEIQKPKLKHIEKSEFDNLPPSAKIRALTSGKYIPKSETYRAHDS